MIRKSKKITEAENWVKDYVNKFSFPPTYIEVANGLGISQTAAHARCRYIRDQMKSHKDKMNTFKMKYEVSDEKLEKFIQLKSEIDKLFL